MRRGLIGFTLLAALSLGAAACGDNGTSTPQPVVKSDAGAHDGGTTTTGDGGTTTTHDGGTTTGDGGTTGSDGGT